MVFVFCAGHALYQKMKPGKLVAIMDDGKVDKPAPAVEVKTSTTISEA